MDTLYVRIYNVRFGDAILVTVPDRGPGGNVTHRNILIDFGNVQSGLGEGGSDAVFKPVIENILAVLQGRPLDLYVMTHEHLDHVQGLPYACTKLGKELPGVEYAWFTASAAPNYYVKHPKAKKQLEAFQNAYAVSQRFFEGGPAEADGSGAHIQNLLANNSPHKTGECVDYLRGLTGNPDERNAYVYRDCDLTGKHPFREARFEIWAPEEDTSSYYRGLNSMALGLVAGGDGTALDVATPIPPAGVDAGAFYNLVELRRQGYADNLMAIDRAANNTSVVLALEWRGWRLLFPGDAEHGSWRKMDQFQQLAPVHFLKVGHHGSWNGTPPAELLEKVLPKIKPDARDRTAAVSTWKPNDTYSGVPDPETLGLVRSRCNLVSTYDDLPVDSPERFYLDVEFQG